MKKSMALIGNLVAQGAGSQELREAAMSRGGLMRALTGGVGNIANGAFGLGKAALHPAATARNAVNSLANKLGYSGLKGEPSAQEKMLESQKRTNDLLQQYVGNKFEGATGGNNNNAIRDSIIGSGNNNPVIDNTNNNKDNSINNKMNNIITSSGRKNNDVNNINNEGK